MASEKERGTHDRLQSQYFNERADIFLQPIPDAVTQKTRRIVQAAHLSSPSQVLDVGTGAGVLIAHFLECGVLPQNIAGCDLSEGMLANAREKYPELFFWRGDILDLPTDLVSAGFPPQFKAFDCIVFNACFGNIFDQREALAKGRSILKPGGRILISHPLGAVFVAQLRAHEPHIVPHLLPNKEQLERWASELDLFLADYIDEKDFYLAILQKPERA